MEQNKCNNCRYFLRHYVKYGARFIGIVVGHCIHHDLDPRTRKKINMHFSCDDWEPVAIQKEERKVSVTKAIHAIANDLNEIKQILIDDNNSEE